MAVHDRCVICDYSEATGSHMMSLRPGANGKVRRYGDDLLCDSCQSEVQQAAADLRPPDETDETLTELTE